MCVYVNIKTVILVGVTIHLEFQTTSVTKNKWNGPKGEKDQDKRPEGHLRRSRDSLDFQLFNILFFPPYLYSLYSMTQTNGERLGRHLKQFETCPRDFVTEKQTGSVTRNLLSILLKHTVNSEVGQWKSENTFEAFPQRLILE